MATSDRRVATRRGTDWLAEALVPVLLHRLANATQLLSGLRALMDVEDGLVEGAADDLAALSEELERMGWALAVLASAGGADLLLERRERRALAFAHELAREALRREGRSLREAEDAWPQVRPEAADGWQLPWAAASVWLLAGRALPEGVELAWRLEGAPEGEDGEHVALVALAKPAPDELVELRAAICRASGELALEERAEGVALLVPARWLA